MAALKWVYVVLLIILLFELGSCRILSDQKDQESSKPDNPGFLAGLGGTWKGIPFLGIRAGGGFLRIGSDRHGKGTFGGGGGGGGFNGGTSRPNGCNCDSTKNGGGGGFNGGTSRPNGCNCDSTKNGGGGGYPTHSNPSGPPVTCRPMNCSNESVSYSEGYRRYLDSSPTPLS
ncbi:loricrin-like [Manihot esculenta]|uniref:Uncharacterized protein n=1 Tax=Manihot esculenta TaxID=3983 RepID=A0ACB7G3N0_MANES|nr:loricrin-like [Manihot esculenta]KAG8634484.1 hypothetical protein MANES_17G044166v8 [Manihot esculenta]